MADEKELQEKIDAAVEKATKALKSKNEELLDEKKALQKKLEDMNGRLDEIESDKKKAEEEAALKSGDVEKIKAQLEAKHAKELEKLQGKVTELSGKLNSTLIDGGLSDALTKANVAPQYVDAVKALIKTGHKAEISEVDGKAVALIDGKPIHDFITGWSQSDSGKHYVAAPANGGGGAGGPNGGGGAPAEKRSQMNHAQKAAYIRDHGKDAYDKLPE